MVQTCLWCLCPDSLVKPPLPRQPQKPPGEPRWSDPTGCKPDQLHLLFAGTAYVATQLTQQHPIRCHECNQPRLCNRNKCLVTLSRVSPIFISMTPLTQPHVDALIQSLQSRSCIRLRVLLLEQVSMALQLGQHKPRRGASAMPGPTAGRPAPQMFQARRVWVSHKAALLLPATASECVGCAITSHGVCNV